MWKPAMIMAHVCSLLSKLDCLLCHRNFKNVISCKRDDDVKMTPRHSVLRPSVTAPHGSTALSDWLHDCRCHQWITHDVTSTVGVTQTSNGMMNRMLHEYRHAFTEVSNRGTHNLKSATVKVYKMCRSSISSESAWDLRSEIGWRFPIADADGVVFWRQ